MSAHLSTAALEAYVIGSLDEAEAAAVEEHVLTCPACEARLQHEARLDLAFTAVAERVERPRRTYAAPIAFAGSALAMAAAIMFWIVPRGEVERPQSNEPPPVAVETYADASTFTARLEVQVDSSSAGALMVDGSRVGVRD